ncbi:TPA: plasmid recombination protein [Streptococcus equi subsp. zooepidemicus]|nr:plasmid recombination protein [Streptococcus equi subsp. zooepidemicus]
MSYLVARMQKMKVGNLGGAYRHNERVFENHSNKDIDTSRSHLNYELTDRDRSVSYEKQIKDYVNEKKSSKRAIRKDAVLCDEWIITSDKDFFERLDQEQTRAFFETAKNYFAERYGLENIAYASVHLDESTPHMHMGVVPMVDGKLSSKAVFTREELKAIQEELPKYMNEQGFELSRGQLGSDKKHLSVADYKAKIGKEALNKELLGLGAPRYWHKEEDRPATVEEIAGYESLASLFSEEEFKIREATLEERFKWLDGHRNDLKGDLSHLEELVDKKIEEYTRIDSETSERLSELSELNSKVKDQEKELRGLESDSERLSDKVVRLEKEHGETTRLLVEQNRNLRKISFQDLDRRRIAKELQEELENATPKLFGDGFNFTSDFVGRMKTFVSDVVEKLEQAVNQNELLRNALAGMKEAKSRLENSLSHAEWKNQQLETENKALKLENRELKVSKNLLDDLSEVITEKEVTSLNKRLENLRETRELSRKRHEPTKGRSI